MWSCDRRSALVSLLALAACGFEPAFGPGGPAKELLEQVTVDAPEDKNEFDLVERLEERLGRSRVPRLTLTYEISTQERGLAITPDDTTARYNVLGTVRYEVRRSESAEVAASGVVDTFTSYAASGTTVSTVSAREDAYRRLMRLLADQIVTELIATSGTWSAG